MAEQQQSLSPTYLLRGPMIATGALVSFAIPYVIELSPRTLWHFSIIILSLLWFCWDVLKCVERTVRISLHKLLDNLVLDDILRMIYDPEDGALACMVGGFMGACTMYGLRLQEDDKTRLVQATMEIDYQQANSLLMAPGGCKAWLPKGMQQWLNQESKSSTGIKTIDIDEKDECEEDDCEDEEETSSNGSSSRPASPLASEPLKKALHGDGVDGETNARSSIPSASNKRHMQQHKPIIHNPTDPVDEMVSILRRLAYSQAKLYIQNIPESLLETVGVSAVALLGAHLHYRRGKQHSRLGVAGNLVLAGVASGAISTAVAKRMMVQGDSFSNVCREMMTRSWKTIKDQAMRKEQWRSYLAMVVLLVLGRRRQQSSNSSRR